MIDWKRLLASARLRRMTSLALCQGAVACVGLSLAGSPAKADPVLWRHGILEPKSDAGFVLMAGEQGFAAKHALKLQIVPLKNETLALRALISGELDSYEGTPPFAAVARGSDVKVIGCYWVGLPHALFVRPSVTNVKEMAGKSLASSSPSSLPDLVAHAMLDHFGVPFASVTFANVGGDSDRYRALSGGVVDAAVVSSEYAPIADKDHLTLLVRARDIMPDFMRLCYHTTAATIAKRGDDVAQFLALESEALGYALAHKTDTVAVTQRETGQKPEDPRAPLFFDDVVATHAIDPTLPLPMGKITYMQDVLLKAGITPKAVDVSSMVDPAPREKALQLLAK